jgi:hypothetical protein
VTRRRAGRAGVVVIAAVAAAAVATGAWAYYAFTSSPSARTVTAASLSAAGAPAATVAGSTSVNVAWTLPSSNLTGATYVVTNTTDNHTVCTVAATVSSCSDTAALPGVANAYSIRTTLPGTSWATAATAFSSAATPDVLSITNAAGGAIGSQAAGTAFGLKVTAQKWGGSGLVTDTAYAGNNKAMTWSGLGTSPGGTAPAYPITAVDFSSGVSEALTATAYNAGSATLTVAEGPRSGSASFTVAAGTPTLRFTSANVACTPGVTITIDSAGGTFSAKVSRDQDAYGNTISTSGTPSVTVAASGNKGTLTGSPLAFANNGAKETSTAFTYTANAKGTIDVTASATGFDPAVCTIKQN